MMTTYHVWLKGQEPIFDPPEIVCADYVQTTGGALRFVNVQPGQSKGEFAAMMGVDPRYVTAAPLIVRVYKPEDWYAWSIVHDEADHI